MGLAFGALEKFDLLLPLLTVHDFAGLLLLCLLAIEIHRIANYLCFFVSFLVLLGSQLLFVPRLCAFCVLFSRAYLLTTPSRPCANIL